MVSGPSPDIQTSCFPVNITSPVSDPVRSGEWLPYLLPCSLLTSCEQCLVLSLHLSFYPVHAFQVSSHRYVWVRSLWFVPLWASQVYPNSSCCPVLALHLHLDETPVLCAWVSKPCLHLSPAYTCVILTIHALAVPELSWVSESCLCPTPDRPWVVLSVLGPMSSPTRKEWLQIVCIKLGGGG